MKTIVIKLAKRYALKAVNKLLIENMDKVGVITQNIHKWITRLQAIVDQLKLLNDRVSDGEIDEGELQETQRGLKELVDNF